MVALIFRGKASTGPQFRHYVGIRLKSWSQKFAKIRRILLCEFHITNEELLLRSTEKHKAMLIAGSFHELICWDSMGTVPPRGSRLSQGLPSMYQAGPSSSLWEHWCVGPGRMFSQTFIIREQYGKEWPRPAPSGTGLRPLATLVPLCLALNLFRVLVNAISFHTSPWCRATLIIDFPF